MSTILERMIQRTRGPLSPLEPVATPAFVGTPPDKPWQAGPTVTPPGLGDPLSSAALYPDTPAGSRGEVTMADASEAAPGHELDLVQRPGARPGRSQARPKGRDRADDVAGPRSEPVPGEAARPVAAAGQVAPTSVAAAPMAPVPGSAAALDQGAGPGQAPGRRSPSRGQAAAANPHPDEDQRAPGADTATRPGEHPHDALARGTLGMHAVPAASPARAGDAEPARAGDEGPDGARPEATAEPDPVTVRPRPVRPQGYWPAPPTPPAPAPAAEARPGPGPEVTISIGHIEVRSAPAAEKPRSRPPFRPQVSLADFLNQDRRP